MDANGCLTESDEIFFTITELRTKSLEDTLEGDILDTANGFIQITMSGGYHIHMDGQWYWFFSQSEDIVINGGTYDL